MDRKLTDVLTEFDQEHILGCLKLLNEHQQMALRDEILRTDFRLLSSLHRSYEASLCCKPEKVFQQADVFRCDGNGDCDQKKKKRLFSVGEEFLSQGKIAVFLVAGGQGTRLGFNGPKGCYRISPVENKCLFQLFAESMRAISMKYGRCPKWYIMTSHENNKQTEDFFCENKYFGLKREDIRFLIQKQIPSLDLNGKLILSRDGKIFKNPNGHGGAIGALFESGAAGAMAEDGVEEIFYFQVDNPLVKIADPLFIGAHIDAGAEMSSKVVKKAGPDEKVGIIGLIDGRLGCIEYSELSEIELQERDPDGRLRFNSANIAVHMINRKFVEKLNQQDGFSLPWHFAIKNIECLQAGANGLVEKEIKGIKFELFIFDALAFACRPVTMEVERMEEFAPVKNRTGVDSPDTAQKAMISRHLNWLKSSGEIQNIPDDLIVEVSPLYAIDEEMFRKKFTASTSLYSPLYLE